MVVVFLMLIGLIYVSFKFIVFRKYCRKKSIIEKVIVNEFNDDL